MTVLVVDARSATWQEIAEFLMNNAKRITGEPIYLCWQGSDYGGELTRLVHALQLEEHLELWDEAESIYGEKIILGNIRQNIRYPNFRLNVFIFGICLLIFANIIFSFD